VKKTILVTDPRRDVQDFLEEILAQHGYDVTGPAPDLVLTPDDGTARFWAKRGVPVYSYEYDEPLAVPDLLSLVAQLLDLDDPPLPH
jgi:hypothetical protein